MRSTFSFQESSRNSHAPDDAGSCTDVTRPEKMIRWRSNLITAVRRAPIPSRGQAQCSLRVSPQHFTTAEMASSSSLYGDRDPTKTKTKHKPINSSTSLAFSSNLSSLIASSKTKTPSTSTNGPSKNPASSAPKASLFTAHRESKGPKPTKKRLRDDEQEHRTSDHVGHADESDLARSKRKMLEKTRIYNAMKRGEYIGRESDPNNDHGGLVDFDKKWADAQGQSAQNMSHSDTEDASSSSSGDDDDNSASDRKNTTSNSAPTETWLDEFGRLIHGTASQKRRSERRERIAAAAAAAFEDSQARPSAPTSELIYGDTIQSAAFNPDTVIQTRMAELAAKRDREATPPEDSHYDGKAEVRTRGTGFFAFSRDEDGRKREMEGLEAERQETERRRAEKKEREEAVEKRRREVQERRRVVEEKRRGKEVDAFLEGLEVEVELPQQQNGNRGGGADGSNGVAVAAVRESGGGARSETSDQAAK